MWGINDNVEIPKVTQSNPYLSYLAAENKTRKTDVRETPTDESEGIELSSELKRLNPVVEEVAEDQNRRRDEEEQAQGGDEQGEQQQACASEEQSAVDSLRSTWKNAFGASDIKKSA